MRIKEIMATVATLALTVAPALAQAVQPVGRGDTRIDSFSARFAMCPVCKPSLGQLSPGQSVNALELARPRRDIDRRLIREGIS